MSEIKNKYFAVFRIRGLPPTLNQLYSMSWHQRMIENRTWKDATTAAFRSLKPPRPLVKARISFTRFSSRPVDRDNWAGGTKPLMDALKGVAILDDSMEDVDAYYFWEKTKVKKGYVEIKIEEV